MTAPLTRPRVLVAGIGNIFFGDDGFGVEVVRRVLEADLPPAVRAADFGIRGIHLAFDLLEHEYELTVLVDAAPRGGEPGTIYLLDPDLTTADAAGPSSTDAHAMSPEAVFAMLRSIGGTPGRVLIVGCEPACIDDGIGLSAPVAGAVDEAVRLVVELASRACAGGLQAPTDRGCEHVSGDSREDRRVF